MAANPKIKIFEVDFSVKDLIVPNSLSISIETIVNNWIVAQGITNQDVINVSISPVKTTEGLDVVHFFIIVLYKN